MQSKQLSGPDLPKHFSIWALSSLSAEIIWNSAMIFLLEL